MQDFALLARSLSSSNSNNNNNSSSNNNVRAEGGDPEPRVDADDYESTIDGCLEMDTGIQTVKEGKREI